MNGKQMKSHPYQWQTEALILCLFMGFGFFINRGIEIKGLYMDDLYLWSCYGEQSFGEFVFPVGSTRFRFLYYLAAYIELALLGHHIGWFVPVNIILNVFIAYTLFRFARRLSGRTGISFLCGLLYLASRMSYYQIGQVYGLMESMALWAAVGILYCLYRYLEEEGPDGRGRMRYYLTADLLYFTICFIHERYMALLPLLLLVPFMRKGKRVRECLYTTCGTFLAVMLIRLCAIGTVAPAGTGGTEVADTFRLTEALRYAVSQVFYLFGINMGPNHLNGMSYGESPAAVRGLILLADVALAVLVALFVAKLVRDRSVRRAALRTTLLFAVFIALCIGCSSVTIRVEVRWIYVSMTAAWLYASYICGVVRAGRPTSARAQAMPDTENRRKGYIRLEDIIPLCRKASLCGLLFLLYGVLMLPVEGFYRGQYPNLYFWPSQLRYNSLAEQTFEKYGEDLFGKTVYIIGSSYEMSDFTARTFFKEFDRERKAEGTKIVFIDSIRDIGQVTDNMLVLREEPAFNAFQDVTDFVRSQKCEIAYGYYRDGWMDESARIRVMTGESGTVMLEMLYPGDLAGGETVRIAQDGGAPVAVKISRDITHVQLQARPYETVELEFEYNFYLKDALEQRGEKHLSMIVNIKTD